MLRVALVLSTECTYLKTIVMKDCVCTFAVNFVGISISIDSRF